MQVYDIIGDIHGHAVELKALLEKLGYKRNSKGVYVPPSAGRMAIFTGDFIDRGRENFEVIDIVRGMVDAGYAHAIMGNHDLNAGMYHTQHEGNFLRPHSQGNIAQHKTFLDEFTRDPTQGRKNIEWLKSLPVCLDLGGVRFVHALWDQAALDFLHSSGLLSKKNTINSDRWHEMAVKGTPGCTAIELLTKGIEIELPEGVTFDAGGRSRTEARLKWWANADKPNLKLHEIIFDVPKESIQQVEAPESLKTRMRNLKQTQSATTFFGHYWMHGELPTVESDHAICIDQSVAKDGYLAAATVCVENNKIQSMGFTSVKSRSPMHEHEVH